MKRIIKLIIVLGFTVELIGCAIRQNTPPLSAEVSIETATIVATRDGAHYFIVFSMSSLIPDNSNARIDYQLLANPRETKTLDLGGLSDSRKITFKSLPDKTVHSDHSYRLIISLYDDSSSPTLIAERDVIISPNIPARVAQLMDIRLL